MDLKVLKSFISVAKNKSFSEAAKELHTVQPAISRHISSLENELGVELFSRNSRLVSITQAGEQLLKDANEIIRLTEQAKSQAILAQNGQMGTLNIAYLGSACLSFMATLVRSYKAQFPKVHVSLFEMTATEQIDALKNKKIDISFSRPLPSSIADAFNHHCIYTDQLVAIINDTHPLAQEKSIHLERLKNESFIIFHRDEALGLFDEIIILCKKSGFSPHIISQPRQMQTLITEVDADLGIAIAPYCVHKLYSNHCKFIPLSNACRDIPLEIQYRKAHTSKTVESFVDIALKATKEIQTQMES